MSEKAWKDHTRNFKAVMAHGDLDSVRDFWNTRQPDSLNIQAISWYRRPRPINLYAGGLFLRIARR